MSDNEKNRIAETANDRSEEPHGPAIADRKDRELKGQDTDVASQLGKEERSLQSPLTDEKEHYEHPPEPEKPFSVFTSSEKWIIVFLASFGGIFSPLTSNIYFPAIPAMVIAFNKSVELINLTVTMYIVLQAIAPMIWGTLGDRWGRRPIFLACLLVLSLSCVGIALTPTNAYWLLMVLRCLQAAGSASTVALGAGVIADVATRAERGGFFGWYSLGPLVGPCIGPVIGGALAQGLGWRSIFWFLCISSACCLVMMFLIFPETLRSIVGDGSIPPPRIYQPPFSVLGRGRRVNRTGEKPPPKKFINPLRLFLYPDISLLLIFTGIINAVFYGVVTSISVLFTETYPFLSETDIGLCFLGYGGGMLLGSLVTGRILDREYRVIKERLIRQAEKNLDKPEDVTKDEHFPIEYARFRTMPYSLAIFTGCVIGYGWTLQAKVSIGVPLVLQIIMGYMTIAIMNTCQTLLIDLMPTLGSSVTACNNLVRCSMAAVVVSVINIILSSVGTGWTYVILGSLCVAVSPMIFVVTHMGPKFRAKRRAQAARLHNVSAE